MTGTPIASASGPSSGVAADGIYRNLPLSSSSRSRRVFTVILRSAAGSAERMDDLAIGGLREGLQRPRPHRSHLAKQQAETGGDRIVRRFVNDDQIVIAHRHVERLEFAAHLGQRSPRGLDALW